jgi:putative transposase
MKGLKSTAQTKYDLRYHFVFVPKYRKRVLRGDIARKIEGLIRYAAQVNEWEIYELAIQLDHVHLYLGAQPKWSPSLIMNRIKGGTSKKIRDLFPDLDEVYWGSTFWADGYLVKSVGEINDKVISMYVKNQLVTKK